MDAAELVRLARDRRESTPEIYSPNDFYGHAEALKAYACLPSQQPLKAVVEHGPSPAPELWDLDVAAPLPTFLCAGDMRAELYRAQAASGRQAIPIGPLIQYAGRTQPRPRGRLLAFPTHSTHHLKVASDGAAFAKTLARYRGRFDDVHMCLYWKDILDGADAPYRAEGFTCTTAGHMYDHAFIHRLHSILNAADTIVTNRFGTHVIYAVAMGRPVWMVPQQVSYGSDRATIERYAKAVDTWQPAVDEIAPLFEPESGEVTDEQRERLAPIAGFEHVRSPEALREVLRDAEERYRRASGPATRLADDLYRRIVRPVGSRLIRPRL
jgi:hypothetical protein